MKNSTGDKTIEPPEIVTTRDIWIQLQDIKNDLGDVKTSHSSMLTELKFHLLILVAYAGLFAYLFLK